MMKKSAVIGYQDTKASKKQIEIKVKTQAITGHEVPSNI